MNRSNLPDDFVTVKKFTNLDSKHYNEASPEATPKGNPLYDYEFLDEDWHNDRYIVSDEKTNKYDSAPEEESPTSMNSIMLSNSMD